MRSNSIIRTAITFLLITFMGVSYGKNYTGELETYSTNYEDDKLSLPVVKIRYKLGLFMGEPTEQFNLYYEAKDKFTEVSTITLTARVVSSNGQAQNAYIKISPLVVAQGEWGWDVAASPNWGSMFFTSTGDAVSARTAQSYFKNGFSLDNLKVINVDARADRDEAYERFADLMSESYISNANSRTVFDGTIPSSQNASYRNNFWGVERNVFKSQLFLNSFNVLGTPEFIVNYSPKAVWDYQGYRHTIFEIDSGRFNTPEKNSQTVEISVIWTNSLTGRTYRRTYKERIKANQRFTVADRIKVSNNESLLEMLTPSYEIHFVTNENEEPLEPKEEITDLEKLFIRDKDRRYEVVREEKKNDIAAVRRDYEENLKRLEEEEKARQLAAEEAKKREEELRKYRETDEYKEQERLRRLAASIKAKEKLKKQLAEKEAQGKRLKIKSQNEVPQQDILIEENNELAEEPLNQYELVVPKLAIFWGTVGYVRCIYFRISIYSDEDINPHELFVRINNGKYEKRPLRIMGSSNKYISYRIYLNNDYSCHESAFMPRIDEFHNIDFQLRTPNSTITKRTVYSVQDAHHTPDIKKAVKLIHELCPSLKQRQDGERCLFPSEYKNYGWLEEYR